MERFFNSRGFYILVFCLLGLLILYMFQQISPILRGMFTFLKIILTPFIIAMIISYVLNPVVNMLNERKVPRTIAVLLIYAFFAGSVTVILMNLIPMFMKQLRELNEHLPELASQAQHWIDKLNNNRMLPESVREGIDNSLDKMEDGIARSISNFVNDIGATINIIFVSVIVPFLVFYMLKDFQIIEKAVITIVPKQHRSSIVRLFIDIDRALGNYIRGQILVSVIVGSLAFVGYWLIGMPYALLLASIVGLFNVIPYVGPFFGAIPAVIMATTVSPKMMLFVISVNVTVQILENSIVSPQVVGRTLHMHPLNIIFVLLVGGEVAGIVGMILAVPLFATLKVIVQHVYLYYVQRKE